MDLWHFEISQKETQRFRSNAVQHLQFTSKVGKEIKEKLGKDKQQFAQNKADQFVTLTTLLLRIFSYEFTGANDAPAPLSKEETEPKHYL